MQTAPPKYDTRPTRDVAQEILTGPARCEPPDGDVAAAVQAAVNVVDWPFAAPPIRVHVDPSSEGCEATNALAAG